MKLLKMYATWCAPCKMLSKVMEDVTIPFPVEEIDIEQQSELAIKYGVRGVPTLVIVDDNGAVIKQTSGYMNQSALEEFIKV